MKLTAGLIYDRLSEYYYIHYDVTSDKNTLVSRPVFYHGNADLTGHVIIVQSPEQFPEPLESGVFICVGSLSPDFPAQGIELLSLPPVPVEELFNRLQAIFDYYDTWEAEMTGIVESDKGYDELVSCATKYLECPISLVDEDFTIIAFADNLGGPFRDDIDRSKMSASIISDLLSDTQYSKGLQSGDVFEFGVGGENFLSYNFKRDGKYLGRITLYFKSRLSKDACRYLFRQLTAKAESMLNKFGSFLLRKESMSSLHEILSDCLRNIQIERDYADYRLSLLGWSFSDEYLLFRLQPEFRHEWQMHAAYLIPFMERQWPGACAIEKDNYVVALLNLSLYSAKSSKDFMQELAYFLRDNLMLAGISRTFRGFDRVSSYYKQTELAVILGRERDPMSWHYCFDDYALDCWIKYGVMNFTTEQICNRILLDLMAYDKENSTEYYKTLRTFFSRKFSYTHAAEDLFIHRTTLIKRIERITELTKIDLDDQNELLYIELSFRYLDKNKAP